MAGRVLHGAHVLVARWEHGGEELVALDAVLGDGAGVGIRLRLEL